MFACNQCVKCVDEERSQISFSVYVSVHDFQLLISIAYVHSLCQIWYQYTCANYLSEIVKNMITFLIYIYNHIDFFNEYKLYIYKIYLLVCVKIVNYIFIKFIYKIYICKIYLKQYYSYSKFYPRDILDTFLEGTKHPLSIVKERMSLGGLCCMIILLLLIIVILIFNTFV
jgi:hypothetical protein